MPQFLSTCGRHLVGMEGEPQRRARSLGDDVRRQLGAARLCAGRPVTPRGSSTASRALTPRRGRWGLSSFAAVRGRDKERRCLGLHSLPLACDFLIPRTQSPSPPGEERGAPSTRAGALSLLPPRRQPSRAPR